MTGPQGCEHAHLDGAYVLGALAPDERLDFERHLQDCPVCARAVQQLAGLPGLLAQVSVDVLETDQQPVEVVPDTLLPALVREVRRGRRRRRWAAGLAAAAAVAALGAASGVALTDRDDRPGPTASPSAAAREMMPLGADGITGWLSLTSVAWGTRLDLTCRYEEPDAGYRHTGPPTYEMVVRTRGGGREEVASWRGIPGRTLTITGATATTVADILSVEVRSGDGHRVLQLED